MKPMIKAIQTKYKGYRFRSRLEARWAVFFDACGVRWEYEPEGFILKSGQGYLPDFYFPDDDLYGEVKPESGDFSKARDFVATTEREIIQLVGTPELKTYDRISFNTELDGLNEDDFPMFLAPSIIDGVCTIRWVLDGHHHPWWDTKAMYLFLKEYASFGLNDDVLKIFCQAIYNIEMAVGKSKSARFEFGESGAES